jgi:histidine ammonia-lyase
MQALELRVRSGELDLQHLQPGPKSMKASVFDEYDFLEEDRPLEKDLRHFATLIRKRRWNLYVEA